MNKLSNLLCLTGCGFHGHLEKGGLVSPNMGTLCRAHELVSSPFSNIGLLEQKLNKTTLHIELCCHVVLERCSETLPVTLLGMSYPGPKTCNDDPL